MNINEKVLALSWKQPFASLMLCGKIETRTWKTNYRGKVLICASKQMYRKDDMLHICDDIQLARISRAIEYYNFDLKLGYAIAIGDLVDCFPMEHCHENDCFVRYNPLLFCHKYDNVQAIKPFEWKGTQGWKEVSKEIIDKIDYYEST